MNIGIIGTGNMGKALIGGLLKTYNQNISILHLILMNQLIVVCLLLLKCRIHKAGLNKTVPRIPL